MKKVALAGLSTLALVLSGCAGLDLGTLFGVDDGQQQEVAIKNPPLSVPPDYDLRPPRGGSLRKGSEQAQRRGRQTMTGLTGNSVVLKQRSAGEAELLRLAGYRPGIDSRVRREVDRETEGQTDAETTFVDKLLKWDKEGAPEGAEKKGGVLSTLGGDTKPVIKRRGEVF